MSEYSSNLKPLIQGLIQFPNSNVVLLQRDEGQIEYIPFSCTVRDKVEKLSIQAKLLFRLSQAIAGLLHLPKVDLNNDLVQNEMPQCLTCPVFVSRVIQPNNSTGTVNVLGIWSPNTLPTSNNGGTLKTPYSSIISNN